MCKGRHDVSKRQKLLCYDRNITNTTLQYAALDISA